MFSDDPNGTEHNHRNGEGGCLLVLRELELDIDEENDHSRIGDRPYQIVERREKRESNGKAKKKNKNCACLYYDKIIPRVPKEINERRDQDKAERKAI
jgi:hypothetical protein